jgi:hypothetical protein
MTGAAKHQPSLVKKAVAAFETGEADGHIGAGPPGGENLRLAGYKPSIQGQSIGAQNEEPILNLGEFHGSPETLSKYSSMICFRRESR